MKFSDINWGSDEAKNDENLREYFFEFPRFNNLKNGTYRYVIGRKGTGKTAVIERIKQFAEDDPLAFYSMLSLRDFPIQDLRSLRDASYRDKAQFVPIWQFLIYIEICKLILRDESISNIDTIKELKEFLDINNLLNSLGFSETVKNLKQTNSKLSILAKWIGAEKAKSDTKEQITSIHYNKIVKILEEKICTINTDCEFWIFIDELDEGYKTGDQNLRLLLLALLRAVEDTTLYLSKKLIKFRPLLVLRSDIFDSLEDNDLNKLDDYILRLKWTSEDTVSTGGVFLLKEVISARIHNSLPNKNWDSIVQDKDDNLPPKTSTTWKYIANRTFERPRDIIKFLKFCSEAFVYDNKYHNKLTFNEVKNAENRYSDWLYKELRDEIQAHLPCWKEAFQCLTSIGKGRFPKSMLDELLEKNIEIKKWLNSNNKNTNDIIELLFDFGIVGNLDNKGRWLFKYKDEDLSWSEDMDLIIHFGLHRKLRIKQA